MADNSRRPNSPSAASGIDGASRAAHTTGFGGSVPGRPANAEQAYAPPQLIKYGRLADLTATVGPKGKNDMGGKRKTGF